MIRSVILFTAGLIMDYLVSLNWIQISEKRALPAGSLGMVVVFLSLIIWENIINQPDNLIDKISYALGTGVGCYWAVKRSRRKKRSDDDIKHLGITREEIKSERNKNGLEWN